MVGIGLLALVAWTGSPIPDLLIGIGISLLVLQGGLRILVEARSIDLAHVEEKRMRLP